MELDDIIYLSLLIFSIGFGYVYRQIKDINQKKWIGTALGIVIVLIVSGEHILHPFILALSNAAIILLVPKRKCHLVSFAFTFLYLLFFRTTIYFGIPYPPSHTNLIQMVLTLKMVGLAFEVNSSYLAKNKQVGDVQQNMDEEGDVIEPTFMDIFHYAFNYVGVLTGPYFRYRTFKHYFELPFADNEAWKQATIRKLMFIPLYGVLFLLATSMWPLSYALSDEFYNDRFWLYRFWYVWPIFFIFRMRIYIGLVLSECVCTMAGLGAYPDLTEPKPGLGPSKNLELKKLLQNPTQLQQATCNYKTILNVNPYGSDFCTTFREGMKHWNICIQYWLAVNIYKRFPNKKLRTHVTMLVSAYWHGIYLGHYVCLAGAPFYLSVEDVWVKIIFYGQKGTALLVTEWIVWFFKMQAFSYLGFPFMLLTLPRIIRYYNSIYYFGFVAGAVLYVIGVQLLKAKKAKSKRLEASDSNKIDEESSKKIQ